MDLLRDESKPAGGAFWADEPTASWPSPPPANLAAADGPPPDLTAADLTAPDRRRAGTPLRVTPAITAALASTPGPA